MIINKTPKSAILYIRTSTTDQENSIENQRKDLNEYCKQHGIKVIAEYTDFGISGKNTYERPEFTKLMNSIRESKEPLADVVLCTKLDRFARSMKDLLNNVEEITANGMMFSTLSQQFETDTPTGKLMFQILGAFAEFERSLINERTREGYRAALIKGDKLCHRPQVELPKKKIIDLVDKGLSLHAVRKLLDPSPSASTLKNRLNSWGYEYKNGKWVKTGGK